ncbi:hypothetical protein [Labilibaculum sp.]|uniref:hypothetical protein n=1 Tax=Labilibaculum sp. TaxID=2060723 RepID=UPI002AA6FEF3|nr:hypothetical protein [Labilibaculum sp.]
MTLNLRLIIVLLILFTSCSNDTKEDINSDDANTELKKESLKELYSDSDFSVYMSAYVSPKKDGVTDGLIIYIKNNSDGTCFVSRKKHVAFKIGDETTEDPSLFLKEASLQIHTRNSIPFYLINEIHNLFFELPYIAKISDYESPLFIDLRLKLINNTIIEKTETFEIVE